jgi:hypothetical protein
MLETLESGLHIDMMDHAFLHVQCTSISKENLTGDKFDGRERSLS